MSSTLRQQIEVELNIGNQLTTISCGHVVVEVLKFIAYQRLQIPYTYQWLKQVINKRKDKEVNKCESYQSERHFHIASTALSNLDFIIKSLLKEIDSAILPEEVCIALGATPVTCKEIYRLVLPDFCHKPQCQSTNIASSQKLQRGVFRALATSEKLGKVFFNILPPTNMYVFIKKKLPFNQNIVCNDDFIYLSGYRIPRSCKVVKINFKTQNGADLNCCNDFKIFGESLISDLACLAIKDGNDIDDFSEIESSDETKWFQSSYVMKGFKDCIVNGSSVTNTWLES